MNGSDNDEVLDVLCCCAVDVHVVALHVDQMHQCHITPIPYYYYHSTAAIDWLCKASY